MVLPGTAHYPVAMADIFTAIADSTRRDILRILLERAGAGEVTAVDLAELLGVTPPTAAKHLGLLREQGLVAVREEGRLRYFHLVLEPFAELRDWLAPYAGDDAPSVEELADEEVVEDEAADSAVFAAWAGTDLGVTIGRRLADRSFRARTALHEASEKVGSALPEVVARRWPGRA
jgi:ArsR family transcriptional regulator